MKYLIGSIKGGVGKSSIAVNMALYFNYPYVTNDLVTEIDKEQMKNFHHLPHNTKRIPKNILDLKNVVYDMGANSSKIDSKLTQAVKLSDCVIIPTLTDRRSLEATVTMYNFIKEDARSIIIVINNYTQIEKFDEAHEFLDAQLNKPTILDIRTTTLFSRVARDGIKWFQNIHNTHGEYRLRITKENHEYIYQVIEKITKAKNAKYSKSK